jgi:anaerobic magnesium-protoporphyrin IX monomethyl ester cyclase
MLNESAIVFCNPPISLKKMYGALSSGGAFIPPLNLLALAAQTRRHGYDTKIVDCAVEKYDVRQSADKITSFNAQYIGLTATTLSISTAVQLAQEIKRRSPSSTVMVGGAHVTALPKKTMKDFPVFDIGVYGEGELTIINLLEALNKKQELGSVRGIVFRDSLGGIQITEKQPFIEDLDTLPLPAWDLLEGFATRYAPTTSRMTGLPSIYITSARGCPYQCIFCDRGVLGNRFRGFSAARVVQMFRQAQELFRVKHITVYDEIMAINRERVVNICQELMDAKLGIHWSCDMRADLISRHEDLPQLMAKAGCKNISFGVESGNQEVLGFYKKGESLEEIKKAVALVHKADIATTGFFILGGPTETVRTIKDTISFAASLELDYALPFYFVPFPGSAIYENIVQYGSLNENWDQFSTAVPIFIPQGLTRKKLEQLYFSFTMKFYLKPRRLWQLFYRNLNPRSFVRLLKTGTGLIPLIVNRIWPRRFS